MKEVYIILTYTGTLLSMTIKFYTRFKFSHVSIALDKELNEMYSFGRINPYIPFLGGFVHERINQGTFKRFYNTVACVYSLKVTDEEYDKISKTIYTMTKNPKVYKYNTVGLAAAALHKRLKFKNSFYCAEFVKYILDTADIKNDLPDIVTPNDFVKIKGLKKEYEGILRNYSLNNIIAV